MPRKNNFLVFLSLLFTVKVFAGLPMIKSFIGAPAISLVENKKNVVLKKETKIADSFTVKTAAKQVVQFQLGDQFNLTVLPESFLKVEGYYLDKTHYKLKKIIFNQGRFYLKNNSTQAEDLTVIYESDFFEWKNTEKNNQREFFIEVNLESAVVRFCAGENGIAASVFDHEIVKNLKYQEGYEFQGKLENDKIAFDVLLEGRKVPKGEWTKAFTCNFKEILKDVTDLESQVQSEAKKQNQLQIEKQRKQKAVYESSLCHEPNGQFQQCLWKKENKNCVRYKCDGLGHWSDAQIQPKSKKSYCETASQKVDTCDY